MSVLVLDPKRYEEINVKLVSFIFNKTVDINYCATISELDYSTSGKAEQAINDHVKNWLTLNEMSFIARYREDTKPELVKFLDLTFRGKTISTVQLLKWLQCIVYNTEISTIKEGYSGLELNQIPQELMNSYNFILNLMQDLQTTIIKELVPEYEKCEWS